MKSNADTLLENSAVEWIRVHSEIETFRRDMGAIAFVKSGDHDRQRVNDAINDFGKLMREIIKPKS